MNTLFFLIINSKMAFHNWPGGLGVYFSTLKDLFNKNWVT